MFSHFSVCSPLQKIFESTLPIFENYKKTSALLGEEISFQIAFRTSQNIPSPCEIKIDFEGDGLEVSLYRVVSLPSKMPIYPICKDEGYLTKKPNLFPEMLSPIQNGSVFSSNCATTVVWVTVKVPENISGGKKTLKFSLKEPLSEMQTDFEFEVDVIEAVLPQNKLPITIWFHYDCLIDRYNLAAFSEEFWEVVGRFIDAFKRCGGTMLLTPIFTPPLDTKEGEERTTVQLIKVKKNSGKYTFDFSLFDKFIAFAKDRGIEFFEISHLFTQWGAKHAPKIIAEVDGEEKRIFGWDTDVRDKEYGEFLSQFLPLFTKHLKDLGIADCCYFHISDEPNRDALESYGHAKSLVQNHLEGFKIIDALSNFDFYKKGIVTLPVVATDAIEPFLKAKAEIFCYYCCMQYKNGVSNRFYSMPSSRNRIIAYQMFYNNIKGFLQWGFNFYNSQLSVQKINPFVTTDALGAFPSGDAFIVLPSNDKKPIYTIGGLVFSNAMQDLRAMQLLESLKGTAAVKKIIKKYIGNASFNNSLISSEIILKMREEINEAIKKQ